GNHFDPHNQSSGTVAPQRHSNSQKSFAGRVRSRADEGTAKLRLSAPARTRARKFQGIIYRSRRERASADSRMGEQDARRFAERSFDRTRPESLGAGLQRGAYLHPKNVRTEFTMLLPTSSQTIARGGRDRAQSHLALHAARQSGRTRGARERFSVPERLHYFR